MYMTSVRGVVTTAPSGRAALMLLSSVPSRLEWVLFRQRTLRPPFESAAARTKSS